jgi:hypothetical protein
MSASPFQRPDFKSEFDGQTKTWKSITLPRHNPDRRDDVLQLDKWITDRYLSAFTTIHIQYILSRLAAATLSGREQSQNDTAITPASIAQTQLKILDLGFSEIVRQSALQCVERAELMDRLWRACHELYESLVVDMSSTIDGLRKSAVMWKEKCELVRDV